MLTTAGHLQAVGYDVEEASLHNDGAPCRALIFAPILMGEDGSDEIDSHLSAMFEVRVNILLTIQQAAEECGVGYRTIQVRPIRTDLPASPRLPGYISA